MRKLLILVAYGAFLGCVLIVAAISFVPELRWRAQVLSLGITGQISGISLIQLVNMMRPGSGYYIEPIVQTRNPFYAISNPAMSPQDVELGKDLFSESCAACHGHEGMGASAPELTSRTYKHGDSDWALFKAISEGIQGSAMPAHDLADTQVWRLVAYVRTLQAKTQSLEMGPSYNYRAVTSARLAGERSEKGNWLSYSGSFDGQRYSELDQINSSNAHLLQVRWIHQFRGDQSIVETSPLVNGEVMFVTEPPNILHALSPATGETYWSYEHVNGDNLKLCCGQVNRGVALHENTVFMGTLDAHLVALDAATGKILWKVKHDDHESGISITAAPLVVKDLVIVGYGGGDLGVRGFVDALSVEDGTLVWRFYTIPAAGEPGNETWSGDSWKTGGAATWLTGVYDPELDLLYWGIGNPGPDYQGDLRKGDNLYSNSVVALDPDTGDLQWHFQFTPHDERDWDSNQIPALVDMEWRGVRRKIMLWPNRNGFYYVLDRSNGEYLQASPFVKQNWAERIDEKGRPVMIPSAAVSSEGTATFPSPIGAITWHSPSYSPRLRLHYLPALEWGQIIYKNPVPAEYREGDLFLGGEHHPIPGVDLYYSIKAVNPQNGEIVWEYDLPERSDWWKTGGLVSTAGDIVFGGDHKELFVLDAVSGERLWKLAVGGRINASPVTYSSGGEQIFAMAAGRSIVAIGLPPVEAVVESQDRNPDSPPGH